jgi:hypothetical protein
MTQNEWLLVYLVFSAAAMICVAVFGYFVAQFLFELHASKIQSPATPHGGRSRSGPVWEVNSDRDEREEAQGDGDEASWGI